MKSKDLDVTWKDVEQLMRFLKLTHQFMAMERKIHATNLPRFENNAEHSFQLVIMAWYIIHVFELELDVLKVMKFIIGHDILEIRAGDTCVFTDGPSALVGKKDRERKALEELSREYPEFSDIWDTIHEYESCESPEAKFAYSVDKLCPILNILMDEFGCGQRTWKHLGTSLDEMLQEKKPKVTRCDFVAQLFGPVEKHLRVNEMGLFPRTNGSHDGIQMDLFGHFNITGTRAGISIRPMPHDHAFDSRLRKKP